MEIDALEQLISEDVKVQGQISCVMVSELASWFSESSSELLPESLLEEMRSTSTTLLPGHRWRSPRSLQCAWTASSFALRKKTLPLHGEHRWSPPTWPLRVCTTSSPGLTKNWPLPWRVEEDARGRCAGMAPLRQRGTSLSWRGDRLHGGRRTETRPRGLLLAEPPPRVAGHTYDRDETATETRKAKAGEGDRRRKEGQSVY
jgi:hypothetical protein